MPTVSVIIPVFNGACYLREALDSVFFQTYHDYEIICVDDGSTDGSPAILGEYGERVTIIRQTNAGQGAARNAGARLAVGVYVAFLDQDDRWYPHKLERQVAAMRANHDAVLVHCNSDRMDEAGNLLQVGATLAEYPKALESPLGRLIGDGLILPSAMLVRRDVLENVGGFDPNLSGFEDFDLSVKLRMKGRFVFLEESGMCRRVHSDGFSRSGGQVVVRSRERFLLRMKGLYAGDRSKQTLISAMLAECYSDWGMHEARAGNRKEGLRMLLRSLRHNPRKFRTYSRLLRSCL
jgi:glycosyltransferase involved in cell wall biosynthesis